MNKSESINELAAALAKAQGTMRGALKDSDNPFFKSKYADLASVVDAIRESFSANGLSYVQTVEPTEKNEAKVGTIICHSSGQWIDCGCVAVPVSKADAQGFGSAITYARRYGLSAAAGVAPEDDDGNAASKAAPRQQSKREVTPPPPPIAEWSEEDYNEAKGILLAYGDYLDKKGLEFEEIETTLQPPRSTIGDERGLDNWKNRFLEYTKRVAKKHGFTDEVKQ